MNNQRDSSWQATSSRALRSQQLKHTHSLSAKGPHLLDQGTLAFGAGLSLGTRLGYRAAITAQRLGDAKLAPALGRATAHWYLPNGACTLVWNPNSCGCYPGATSTVPGRGPARLTLSVPYNCAHVHSLTAVRQRVSLQMSLSLETE